MKNLFSVDLEEWYAPKIFTEFNPKVKDNQILHSIRPILKLLEKYKIRATFFVLGNIVERHPELIRELHDRGHEIASHGYSHIMLNELNEKAFCSEVKRSVKLIKSVINEKPIGFRAPNFSLNKNTKWALKILEANGFRYDSSLFPFKSRFYGEDGVPNRPFKIWEDDTCLKSDAKLIEYPITMMRFMRIPFIIGGGFYLRFYGTWLIKRGIKYLNKRGIPANIYIHPWEACRKTPKIKMKRFANFVTYHGTGSALKKLEHLFKNFEFTSFLSDIEKRL